MALALYHLFIFFILATWPAATTHFRPHYAGDPRHTASATAPLRSPQTTPRRGHQPTLTSRVDESNIDTTSPKLQESTLASRVDENIVDTTSPELQESTLASRVDENIVDTTSPEPQDTTLAPRVDESNIDKTSPKLQESTFSSHVAITNTDNASTEQHKPTLSLVKIPNADETVSKRKLSTASLPSNISKHKTDVAEPQSLTTKSTGLTNGHEMFVTRCGACLEAETVPETTAATTSITSVEPNPGIPTSFYIKPFFDPDLDLSLFTRVWNQSLEEPVDFHLSICTKRCKGKHKINVKNAIPSHLCARIECFPCECYRPTCEIYGTCCPEMQSHEVAIMNELSIYIYLDNSYPVQGPLGMNDTETVSLEPETNHEHSHKQTLGDGDSSANAEYDFTLTCDPIGNGEYGGFLNIRSCPSSFAGDPEIRKMCEIPFTPGDATVEQVNKVTDNASGVTYYNIYCALCNGALKTRAWTSQMMCSSRMRMLAATTEKELLTLGLMPNSSCLLYHDLPGPMPFPVCDIKWFTNNVIDKCNVTGRWKRYDTEIQRACHDVTDKIYRVWISAQKSGRDKDKGFLYKNIFCALCNQEEPHFTYKNCKIVPVGTDRSPPFTFLLGLDNNRRTLAFLPPVPSLEFSDCQPDQWASPDGRCLAVKCTPGKVWEESKCRTGLDSVRGLGYSMELWLVPTAYHIDKDMLPSELWFEPQQQILDGLISKVHQLMWQYVTEYNITYGALMQEDLEFEPQTRPTGSAGLLQELILPHAEEEVSPLILSLPSALWFSAHVLTVPALSRDEMEAALIRQFVREKVSIPMAPGMEMTFEPLLMPRELRSRDVCLNQMSFQARRFHCYTTSELHIDFDAHFSSSAWGDLEFFVPVSSILNCNHVTFDSSEYEMTINETEIPPRIKIVLDLNTTQFMFDTAAELNQVATDKDGLKVCTELLNVKVAEKVAQAKLSPDRSAVDNAVTSAQYVATLVCLAVSMLCLALTLLTYFLFPSLRTQAGKNNMGMCGTLLLAQMALLVSSHIQETGPVCTALGMATHFTWLCMLCWSFVCCLYMLHVFVNPSKPVHTTPTSQRRFMMRAWLFSVITPTIVVAIVVTEAKVSSGGRWLGYGHRTCYLETSLLIGLSFALPLAVLTVCNLIFLAVAAIKIRQVGKVQQAMATRTRDRKNILIYSRLSTLTGAFWSLAILAEGLDSDILRFVAIFLNGLQGCFLFLSYTCNRRVLKLYMEKLGRQPEVHRSTNPEQAPNKPEERDH